MTWIHNMPNLSKDELIQKINEFEQELEFNKPYATGMQSPDMTEKEIEKAQAKQDYLQKNLLSLYRAYHKLKTQEHER